MTGGSYWQTGMGSATGRKSQTPKKVQSFTV